MKSKVLFATIVSFLCFSLSTMGIMASVPKETTKPINDDKVVVKSNVEEMTVEVTEAVPEEETYEEETTKKKKKKKKKLSPVTIGGSDNSDDNYDDSYDDSYDDNYSGGYDDSYDDSGSSGGGAVNNYYYGDSGSSKKKKKKNNNSYKPSRKNSYSKPKPKKKAIRAQSEKNALSGGKVNLLRSQIKHKISGSSNGELTNLAKYMANRNLSNASSVYQKLTNVSGNVSCATYKLKVSTNDQLAILEVANKIKELKTSKYGIGIHSTEANVGYKIYVVICYK